MADAPLVAEALANTLELSCVFNFNHSADCPYYCPARWYREAQKDIHRRTQAGTVQVLNPNCIICFVNDRPTRWKWRDG